MPGYQEALSAKTTAFTGLALEMTEASIELSAYQIDYGSKVTEINTHWQDTANEAFNGEVGSVNDHLAQVIGELDAAAASLDAVGTRLLLDCNMMLLVDASLKATGFDVLPTPQVVLSAAQRAMIASAGPLAGLLESSLQAQAVAGTLQLESLLALINGSDATGGTALDQSAGLLRPLEDKSGVAQAPPAPEEETGAPGQEEGSAEEERQEEEESAEEEPEEDSAEPSEEGREEPAADTQRPETPQTPQMPQTPQSPSGLEDLAQPEMPDLENPWDASELPDPDDPAGGLASGGGLGSGGVPGSGGLGSGGLGGLGSGAGAVSQGGMGVGAMAAAAGTGVPGAGAPGSGGKSGAVGTTGSGGGRGVGAGSDEETDRESNLIEDPDEDVWGIAKAADERYA
jgi:uncharacterized protein YukE